MFLVIDYFLSYSVCLDICLFYRHEHEHGVVFFVVTPRAYSINDVVGHQIVFFFFFIYVFPPILYVFTTACRGER